MSGRNDTPGYWPLSRLGMGWITVLEDPWLQWTAAAATLHSMWAAVVLVLSACLYFDVGDLHKIDQWVMFIMTFIGLALPLALFVLLLARHAMADSEEKTMPQMRNTIARSRSLRVTAGKAVLLWALMVAFTGALAVKAGEDLSGESPVNFFRIDTHLIEDLKALTASPVAYTQYFYNVNLLLMWARGVLLLNVIACTLLLRDQVDLAMSLRPLILQYPYDREGGLEDADEQRVEMFEARAGKRSARTGKSSRKGADAYDTGVFL